MITPAEIEAMPLKIEAQFKELELRIMQDIIRKLKANGGEITRATDWQIHRLYELGLSKKEIKSAIQSALDLSDSEIEHIYSDVISCGYARDKSIYEELGKEFISFKDNKPLQQLISSVKNQTKDEFKNITQSMGFAVRQSDGKLKFKPIADYYQDTLDKAMLDITSGAFDYNTVLKRTISEMTNSGLRTVDYASGWSNRVNVAVRRAIVTGFNQVVAKVNEDNAEKLETNTFEISWHSGHRPSHWWGGQWFTKDELVSVCGLGTPEGLCGCNCYHSYSAVIPGVSVPAYTEEQLKEMEAQEQKKKKYGDKEYTKYEALQRQRRLETKMRVQRQKIKLLQEGGADENDIIAAKCRYRAASDEYVRFSKAMDLPQQRERVTVDGLNNIGDVKVTASDAVRNTGATLKYNPNADFSITLGGYDEKVLNGLSKASERVADLGGRDGNEHLAMVNLKTGEIEYEETGTDTFVGGTKYVEFISTHLDNNYAFVHNHNTDGYFSETDMNSLLKTKNISSFIAVRLDGVKYIAERTKRLPSNITFDELYGDELKNLNKLSRDGIISAGERTHRREEIIVNNLLKDYTKGLVELDGRK